MILPATILYTLRVTLASGKRDVFIAWPMHAEPSMVG